MSVGLFLQSISLSGGSIGNFFAQLEQIGFFSYALPFLIIFAIIFGVLTNIRIFGNNKTIYAVLALSVSFLALQFGIVSQFFSEIFPRLGVWLSVILVIFIVIGLFNPTNKWNKGIMMLLGVVILVVILWKTFGLTWYTGYWLPYNWHILIAVGVIIFVIGSIISSAQPKKPFSIPETLSKMFESSGYGGK